MPFSSANATWYYYPLYASPEVAQPLAFVEHSDVLMYFLDPRVEGLPAPGVKVTVRGVIGLKELPKDVLKQYGKVYKDLPLLLSEKQLPEQRKVLLWFIPVAIGFFIGAFLLLQWVYLFKTQFGGRK